MTDALKTDPILLEWCETLLARGELEEAEKFAKALHESNEHATRLLLARTLKANEKGEEAAELLDRHLNANIDEIGPEMFEISQLYGSMIASMGKWDAAEDNLKHALKILPKGASFERAREITEYQLGSLYAARGKFKSAQKLFDKGLMVNCGNNWKTSTKTVDFFAEDKLKKSHYDLGESFSETLSKIQLKPEVELIYLVSGDLRYCKKFGSSLLRQIKAVTDKKIHLHIHGVSVGEQDARSREPVWNKFRDDILSKDASVSFSRRHLNKNNLSAAEKKSIYSFERYFILPSILEQYELPVLVADIDQLPLRNPVELLEQDFDVALLRFPNNILNILSVVSATLSLFRPSLQGKAAANSLRNYFVSTLQNRESLNWHVDQAGLAVLDYKNVDAKIIHLSPKLVVTDPTKYHPEKAMEQGAWFWSVTNSIEGNAQKLDDFEEGKSI